ncbi:MAG: sigma-54-dependent Fis family transcriptional regulator [Deltaproteobacteria bacterium]|nr:sigma-54-dependent Fis family transcriptional regulator [Deltaproteobacteria bacterium]
MMRNEHPMRVLLVDDEDIVRRTIGDYLLQMGLHVDDAPDGNIGLEMIEKVEYDLALVDIRMPGMDGLSLLRKIRDIRPDISVIIITGHGNMEAAIQALRLGAVDFLTKPIKLLELDALLEKSARLQSLRQDKRRLRETIGGLQTLECLRKRNRQIIGTSQATQRVRERIKLAAMAGCDTILLTGETGTGKEVAAREIHFLAEAEDSPFIAVSCPALPESLVESELFGHVKGAYTGATENRAGYFELADGGTLFLDEVAELSPRAQAKLLRALETRTVRRVGGSKEILVDLRVVAATNVSLEECVEARRFRRDLFYRLNVFSIHLQPLRERREDIMPLAENFLAGYAEGKGLRFDGIAHQTREVLMGYDFPGNARELRNLIDHAAILAGSGQIKPEHICLPRARDVGTEALDVRPGLSGERERILEALDACKWNRRQTAKRLGVTYAALRYRMKKHEIE